LHSFGFQACYNYACSITTNQTACIIDNNTDSHTIYLTGTMEVNGQTVNLNINDSVTPNDIFTSVTTVANCTLNVCLLIASGAHSGSPRMIGISLDGDELKST